MLKLTYNKLSEEHKNISHLLIQKNIKQLKKQYGSIENALNRLEQLEYWLNYRK